MFWLQARWIAAAALALLAQVAAAEENVLLQELLAQGVKSADGDLRLPPPTMADGLDAAAQRRALASIADANHPVESLLRRSVVAPFVLKIGGDEPAAAKHTLRRVDLWFIAYGDLKQIKEEDFLTRAFEADFKPQSEGGPRSARLTEKQLDTRGIKADLERERYGWGRFTLFDRVQISGTVHGERSTSAGSAIAAGVLDPRFQKDAEFPNQWRSVRRDDAGRVQLGPPQPYAGFGCYAKATALDAPAGAIFLEFHLAFDEPSGWFNGANLLRSKLPIVVQDGVRKLRRRLAAAT